MDVSIVKLLYTDPPVTKADLVRAQQAVEPINFPAYKAEISDKAKALAAKLSETKVEVVKKESAD